MDTTSGISLLPYATVGREEKGSCIFLYSPVVLPRTVEQTFLPLLIPEQGLPEKVLLQPTMNHVLTHCRKQVCIPVPSLREQLILLDT